MIVSLLQRMGFAKAKPVHSPAGEAQSVKPVKGKTGLAGPIDHVQEIPARRHEVNAKSGKDSKAAAAKTKVTAVAKPKGKPVAAPSKPVVKPVVKAASKAPVKPAAKPAAVPKALAKVAPKAAAKPAVAKPAVKASAKPVALPKVVAAKKATPPDSKPVISKTRAVASPASMPVSKTSAKSMQTTVSSKSKTSTAAPTVAEKVAATPVAAVVPAKAGRPSSRLAQLTVPSIAQSVASTAAKASYSQSEPMPIIVPALPSSIKKDPKLANNWKTTPVADLTDAELMAMPDSEYMNSVQLAAFRLKLTKLKLDILNSAGETTEHLREDTSVVPDPADRATIEEEHALELRTRDRERKLLKKIEQSIGLIDAGDYGYCDETGEAIGVGRLLARPTATLSLEAQQRRELKQKMFGD